MILRNRQGIFLCLLLVGIMGWGPAFGLSLNQGADQVDLKADDGIEWQSENKIIIANGNAQAVYGDVTVKADKLLAHYRETDEGTDIFLLEAKGKVIISTDNETGTGDSARYDMDQAVFTLYGDPVRLVGETETITATHSLEYWRNKNKVVARGDSLAVQGERTIRADVLVANFAETASGETEMVNAEAFGNVVLTTIQDKIYGEKGDYDAQTEVATLSGSVRIERENSILEGGYAWVNLKTGISKLFGKAPDGVSSGDGRIHGTFTPEEDVTP